MAQLITALTGHKPKLTACGIIHRKRVMMRSKKHAADSRLQGESSFRPAADS